MIITVPQADLVTALRRAGVAINPAYSPSRGSVILETVKGGLRLGATDGTLGVALNLLCEVKEHGRALLPHKRLSAIAAELPEGALVEITVKDGTFQTVLKAAGTKRKFTMSGLDPLDYPPVLDMGKETHDPSFTIDAKSLVSAAGDVKQSIDPSRVDAALLQPDGKARFQMVAVGTSFSIASGELVESETRDLEGVVLPSVLLGTASAFGGKSDTLVRVAQDDKRVYLTGDGCMIFCSKLHGDFPGWWRMGLENAPKEPLFSCSAERFLECVRAVSVAADVEGAAERFVQIDVRYDKGSCVVSTRASEKNYGEDELEVTGGSDRSCVMHLDGQRLSLALRAAAPGQIDVFYDVVVSNETFYIKSDTFLGMFMPVRVVDPPKYK